MVDWDEVVQGAIAFAILIGFCAFIWWIVPDPIPIEEQMNNCMIVNNNNTKLCEVEVGYDKWVKYK